MNSIRKLIGPKIKFIRSLNVGRIVRPLHRLTGLVLLGCLCLHLMALGSNILFGEGTFDNLMTKLESRRIKLLGFCLFLMVGFHIINGLRITILDFRQFTRGRKRIFWIGIAILVIILAIVLIMTLSYLAK